MRSGTWSRGEKDGRADVRRQNSPRPPRNTHSRHPFRPHSYLTSSSPLHALATTITHDLTPQTSPHQAKPKRNQKKPITAYQTGANIWNHHLRFRRQHWEKRDDVPLAFNCFHTTTPHGSGSYCKERIEGRNAIRPNTSKRNKIDCSFAPVLACFFFFSSFVFWMIPLHASYSLFAFCL